jgi:hypothetical protein
LAERNPDELKQFYDVEAAKEINVPALRSLFEVLGISPGSAQLQRRVRMQAAVRCGVSW